MDCDRSKQGNGFPRRWNQRDHMRRVHDYEEKETKDRGAEQNKRRKTQGAPTSAAMKRSASSAYSKAQAMAGAAISPRYGGRVNQARYNAPVMYSAQMRPEKVQYPSNMPDVSQCLPSRSKAYPG